MYFGGFVDFIACYFGFGAYIKSMTCHSPLKSQSLKSIVAEYVAESRVVMEIIFTEME